MTSLGGESWLRPDFASPTFSLVDFASYPFEVISQSGEYNHMLISVSRMGGGFGDPGSPSPCLGVVPLCLDTGDGLPKIVALRHCCVSSGPPPQQPPFLLNLQLHSSQQALEGEVHSVTHKEGCLLQVILTGSRGAYEGTSVAARWREHEAGAACISCSRLSKNRSWVQSFSLLGSEGSHRWAGWLTYDVKDSAGKGGRSL